MSASIQTIIRNNPISSVLIGIGFGFLGGYVVSWLRGETKINSIWVMTISKSEHNGKWKTAEERKVSHEEFCAPETISQLNALRTNVGWLTRTPYMWQRIFQTSTIVCVKHDQNIIGFGSFVGNGRAATLLDISVQSGLRRQGIGTLIMKKLLNEIESQKYFRVDLSCDETNKDFYAGFSFVSQHAMKRIL